MTHSLFDSLARVHRYDDLEQLLDFVCEAIVSSTGWSTAFITFYIGDGVQYGAAGCPPDTKARFRKSYENTSLERRLEKRRQMLEFVSPGTNVCFIPAGEGPRPATAFVPSPRGTGTWQPENMPQSCLTPGPLGSRKKTTRPDEGMNPLAGSSA